MTEEAGLETAEEGQDSPRMKFVLGYLKGGKRIADIGCNTGWFLDKVDCDFKVGIDCDESFREPVEKRGYTFIHGYSWNLYNVPDSSFDRVHFGQVLAHMREDLGIESLREIYRILCDGGILVMSTVCGPMFTAGLMWARDPTRIIKPLISWFHHLEWEPPNLLDVLLSIGFEVPMFTLVPQVEETADSYKRYRFVQVFVCKKVRNNG